VKQAEQFMQFISYFVAQLGAIELDALDRNDAKIVAEGIKNSISRLKLIQELEIKKAEENDNGLY